MGPAAASLVTFLLSFHSFFEVGMATPYAVHKQLRGPQSKLKIIELRGPKVS